MRPKISAGAPINLAQAVAEAAKIFVTVSGAPRTKENHGSIYRSGGKKDGRIRVVPSKPWTDWCATAEIMVNGRTIRRLLGTGVLASFKDGRGRPWEPLGRTINVQATFYRDAASGDAVGYYQGLADLLEKRGILTNDRLIVSWDGSRLAKDAENPRTEIVLTEAV